MTTQHIIQLVIFNPSFLYLPIHMKYNQLYIQAI